MALTEGDAFTEGQAFGYGLPAVSSPDYRTEDFLAGLARLSASWLDTPFWDDCLDGVEAGREARN